MEQKKWKFNVIDVIAVVLIVAAAALVGMKLMNRGDSATAETVKVTYQVKVEGVPAELYENCLEHIPSKLMASGALVGGEIVSVEKTPYYVLGPDGQWVEDPDHVNLYLTATTEVNGGPVMTTKIGDQEVRIGKKDYILKSEYVEFQGGTIVDVHWGE